ncbi:MAG: TrkH family potassium uptake protein [Thermoplasmatota archaeon]
MKINRILVIVARMNIIILVLTMLSFLVDLLYGDFSLVNILRFSIPFGLSSVVYITAVMVLRKRERLTRRERYISAIASFLYIVIVCSLPFVIDGILGPADALFESMAGLTTTGLSTFQPAELTARGHGLMFFRVALQWVGGLFYLVFAFMFLSDLADTAKRSADRKIFSRIGLVPNLSTLLQNLTIIYGIFTFASFLAFYIGGMDLFDSICLSLSTVSTGGFTSTGRTLDQGSGIHLLVIAFMFLTGMGYYVHMSIFSARGRKKTIMDVENISYLMIILVAPTILFIILVFDGLASLPSLWKGSFAAVSAITTTGFMVDGMNDWPDSSKFLLLVLMLIGGSSLSLASGFKVQRVFLLLKGFLNEVKSSSHPNAVVTLRRGEGSYSEKALEAANMTFFYLFGLMAISIGLILIFRGDMFSVISLCVTSIANSGIAFGEYADPGGIASLNAFVKLVLVSIMFLGRFEVLLPLYFLSMRGARFTG